MSLCSDVSNKMVNINNVVELRLMSCLLHNYLNVYCNVLKYITSFLSS